MASLFEFDENGEIVYEDNGNGTDGSASPEVGLPDEGAADPEENIPEVLEEIIENEVLEGGTDNNQVTDSGTDVSDEIQSPEILEETQEGGQTIYLGDEYNINLLSDEIQELLVNALAPASGTLGTSTLDYFDRIVSGLPSDYVYIAYRTDAQNSVNGVLYYSGDYEVQNGRVTFGEDTTEVRVVRSTYNGVNNVVQYYENNIDGTSIGYDLDGDILYYTNAQVGYPMLGGYSKPFDYSPLIAVGLLCVMAMAIIQKIFLKR